MLKQLLLWTCLLGVSVLHAAVGRMIQVQGLLVTSNKTQAVLKDDKGIMKIPPTAINAERMKVGQWVTASVDLLDFYRLNPEKFKDLQK